MQPSKDGRAGTMATKTKLKAKHERFCQEYIKDPNGAQAAIRAGYSKRSARQTASELLTYPNIQARLAELMSKAESKAIMSRQEVLEEISLLGRTDISQFVEVADDGAVRVLPFDSLPPNASRCIRKIRQKTVRRVDPQNPKGQPLEEITTEFELWSKENALDMLGRHHNAFKPKDDDEDGKGITVNITYTEAKKP